MSAIGQFRQRIDLALLCEQIALVEQQCNGNWSLDSDGSYQTGGIWMRDSRRWIRARRGPCDGRPLQHAQAPACEKTRQNRPAVSPWKQHLHASPLAPLFVAPR